MEEKYKIRFKRIKILFWIAIVGVPLFIASQYMGTTTPIGSTLYISTFLCALPFIVYFYCISILHWKDRYQGTRSDLWGIILLIETSGWFKIVYLFRHMLPDMRGTGRYAKEIANQSSEPTCPPPLD